MMAQSSAIQRGSSGVVTSTKTLPGCMSAWKKLCTNTCVKKVSTPRSASSFRSVPAARRRSTSATGMPCIRSATMTLRELSSVYRRGT